MVLVNGANRQHLGPNRGLQKGTAPELQLAGFRQVPGCVGDQGWLKKSFSSTCPWSAIEWEASEEGYWMPSLANSIGARTGADGYRTSDQMVEGCLGSGSVSNRSELGTTQIAG
jgi:hypothetical protein